VEVSAHLNGGSGPDLGAQNRRLALRLAGVALFFTAFGFLMVPLYDVFCTLTGFNGKTNTAPAVVEANTQVDAERWVTVEFLSHTLPGSGLQFKPEVFSQRINPGAIQRVNYTITNTSKRTFVGQAVPSVTPAAATSSFEKLDCFCFSQQTFAPGETRVLPVVFVLHPKLDRDVQTVTLSYTFFEAPAGATSEKAPT